MNKLVNLFLLIMMLFFGFNSKASQEERIILNDLEWVNKGKLETYSLKITDLLKHNDARLKFKSYPDLCIYINDKLRYHYEKEDTIYLNLQQLPEKTNELLFFHPKGNIPRDESVLVKSVEQKEQEASISVNINPISRKRDFQTAGTVFVSLFILLGFVGFIKNSDKNLFFSVYNLVQSSSRLIKKNLIPTRFFSSSAVNFQIFAALACTFIVYFLFEEQVITSKYYVESQGIFYLIGLPFFFFFLFIIKYIFLQISSYTFNLTGVLAPHYFEYFRILLGFFTILIFLIIIDISLGGWYNLGKNLVWVLVYIYLILNILRIGYILNKLTSFRKIYLFFYLCTTEILPVIVIIKAFS